LRQWGFKYSTRAFTWLKTRRSWVSGDLLTESDFPVGLGLTVRHQTEIVLLARRGNCRRRRKDVRELILAPRREHSRKPNGFTPESKRTAMARLSIYSRANVDQGGIAGGMKSPNTGAAHETL
jgi:N6-adenosine-specific RNA methylase IME4